MIDKVHHFALIVSSEESVTFYERLGFVETKRICRQYDTVVLMEGHGIEIEMFIDPRHPSRATNPENIGLRHLAFKVDNLEEMRAIFDCGPIIKDWRGDEYCFTADPDGLPIEFHL